MPNLNDYVTGLPTLGIQLRTAALSSSTAAIGEITPAGGASIVLMINTGGTPGTYTTRTVAQMISDGLTVGQTWLLGLVNNQGTGVLTLGAGSGAVVGGTATVAINSLRIFTVTVNSASVITFTGLALGWVCTV